MECLKNVAGHDMGEISIDIKVGLIKAYQKLILIFTGRWRHWVIRTLLYSNSNADMQKNTKCYQASSNTMILTTPQLQTIVVANQQTFCFEYPYLCVVSVCQYD